MSGTLCPQRPFPHLSACVREDGHDGKCVFARGERAVLNFYEQGRGRTFRLVVHADLKPGPKPTRMEAAALYAILSTEREEP